MLTYSLPRPTFTRPNGWCPVLCSNNVLYLQKNDCNKNWLSHKNRNHVNTDFFLNLEKKLDFIGPNGIRIRKNEFSKLTYMSSPGQPQPAPRVDTRSYTEKTSYICRKTIINKNWLSHRKSESREHWIFFEFRKKVDFIGPKGIRIQKK